MRTFLLSIIIFLAIATLATANAVTFREKTTEIITALETLPDTPTEQHTIAILNLWEQHKCYFNLTTSHAVTDSIDEKMCILKNASSANDIATSRDTLVTLLTDMKESASISLDRIF